MSSRWGPAWKGYLFSDAEAGAGICSLPFAGLGRVLAYMPWLIPWIVDADGDAQAGVGGAHHPPRAAKHPEKGGAHARRQRCASGWAGLGWAGLVGLGCGRVGWALLAVSEHDVVSGHGLVLACADVATNCALHPRCADVLGTLRPPAALCRGDQLARGMVQHPGRHAGLHLLRLAALVPQQGKLCFWCLVGSLLVATGWSS